jgi:hypothetical protein
MNNYYVYGLFDQNENCFYIGKGRDRRMYNHRKNFKANKITIATITSILNNISLFPVFGTGFILFIVSIF